MNKKQYIELARAAVSDLDNNGITLTESVKSAAADMNLNSEQTRRLAEFTNVIAHLHVFDKKADDKYIEFDLVDPDVVAAPQEAPACEKVAAAEVDLCDFFLDFERPSTSEKVASAEHEAALAVIRQTDPVDAVARPYAGHRSYKIAARLKKTARALEIQTRSEYERYTEGVQKLAYDLERELPEEREIFTAAVRGLYKDAEVVLAAVDSFNPKLQVSEIKTATAFPSATALTQSFETLIVDRQRVLDTGRGLRHLQARLGA